MPCSEESNESLKGIKKEPEILTETWVIKTTLNGGKAKDGWKEACGYSMGNGEGKAVKAKEE